MAPQGKGVVCTLHEGDDFGKLSLLTEGERSASIRTREYNCFFLKIDREDFRRILLSVESSTMKVMNRGREVMHLQRESVGRSVSHLCSRGLGVYYNIAYVPQLYSRAWHSRMYVGSPDHLRHRCLSGQQFCL